MSPNRGDGKKTTFSLLPQATVRPAEATPPLCCPARYRSHGDGGWGTAGVMGDSRPLRERCGPAGAQIRSLPAQRERSATITRRFPVC